MSTTFSTAADFRKSLEARLKNISTKEGVDLQRLRRQVAFDRLLARIFSGGDTGFLLKGGYAMELRVASARSTKDIDLTWSGRLQRSSMTVSNYILEEVRALTDKDLGDFFTYKIAEARMDLENAPYGGARFPVSSFVGGRPFVSFHLDVGADSVVDTVERTTGADWLGFCDIPAPEISMISVDQQYAEKLHAYSLPRDRGTNSRTKDLIDMALLETKRDLDTSTLRQSVERVFAVRRTHAPPKELLPPPEDWGPRFAMMSEECGLGMDLSKAYDRVRQRYAQIRNG
jgi:Nucleotidyl transferase AbiEii toxin, Type IV TA system